MPPPPRKRSATTDGDHRRGPRRRGRALEHAILKAALDELTETGYAGLTMERVAARARTGKAALYRRWPSRAELVVDAWRALRDSGPEPPDTGSLRTDVIAVLRSLADHMEGPNGDILRGLLTEMVRDREFARVVRERALASGPEALQRALLRAVERGEIQPWVPASRRAAVALELLRSHYLLYGTPVADQVLTEIVDDVYLPLLRAPR
ncbi:TetR/AcrR family transcriptional regulator [Streptomyces boncukensis]|uniref:TetR/AcrR family transcriptional regulator n=1 Tax=Streptomyces boncukensis TaxID=2711219 RepID=A0A6G4XAK9_9ACTN|nr:TetR/AcrR family transcriptional regulator [Streptomyces boncukensis]NGO73691.1 TetR/AcrR family transcriptional regulator [Streptomyces boncukensis]